MQAQLIKLYEQMGDAVQVQIEPKNLKRYQEIAYSQSNMASVLLLKAYISLNGKKQIKEKAERLIKRMRKAVEAGKVSKEDKYAEKLNQAYVNLHNYITNNPPGLTISKSELNGIKGLISGTYEKKKPQRRKLTLIPI
jgi:deoxyadenosine/deoxycytidine kinase